MATKEQPIPTKVSVDWDGTLHKGSYTVNDGVVTVRSLGGSVATQVGHSSVASVAQLLLLELVAKHLRETATLNALVTSRRSGADNAGAVRSSQEAGSMHPPNLLELAIRLDHIQALADEFAKCHRDPLVQMDLAPRLQHEILAARLALNPPR
jgi:hypothetical protein